MYLFFSSFFHPWYIPSSHHVSCWIKKRKEHHRRFFLSSWRALILPLLFSCVVANAGGCEPLPVHSWIPVLFNEFMSKPRRVRQWGVSKAVFLTPCFITGYDILCTIHKYINRCLYKYIYIYVYIMIIHIVSSSKIHTGAIYCDKANTLHALLMLCINPSLPHFQILPSISILIPRSNATRRSQIHQWHQAWSSMRTLERECAPRKPLHEMLALSSR